jgi:hypothetical protein
MNGTERVSPGQWKRLSGIHPGVPRRAREMETKKQKKPREAKEDDKRKANENSDAEIRDIRRKQRKAKKNRLTKVKKNTEELSHNKQKNKLTN